MTVATHPLFIVSFKHLNLVSLQLAELLLDLAILSINFLKLDPEFFENKIFYF